MNWRCSLLTWLAAAAPSLHAQSGVVEQDGWAPARSQVQFFRVPMTRDAAELAARARDHMRAERWSEALDDLQRLVTDHRGDLLPDSFDEDAPSSIYRVHTGAAEWAVEQLSELPAEARELYGLRFGPYAEPALADALSQGARRALVDVAQGWPIAPAARRAWWVLGDLELELGHVDEALRCWRRAQELSRLAGVAESVGVQRRFESARELLRGDAGFSAVASGASPDGIGSGLAATPGGLHLPGPNEARGPVPQRDADEPWRYALPDNPFERDADAFTMYPVLAEDRLLINTTLQVACVDAYSGRELWLTNEPAGWDALLTSRREDFFEAVDRTNGMFACAASNGVVVAPLQIPYENLPNDRFQGITIMKTIPERRLFAFDIESGAPLWDHTPPPLWDGLSGPFQQRSQVCGPPVIAGSRVLVPSYRLHGRIDFHVACYELFSGELLWETGLISGQRELNMFGRHEEEFCAPPVRVEDDRVVALTQLGTVAALDLYTGRLLWESLYEQIPLPRNHGWRTQDRQQYWRNSPPAVADGTVLVTPVDSDDLIAFDLETGAQLWSRGHSHLRGSRRVGDQDDPNVLLGADSETVYLGGRSIVAVRRPGGVASARGGFQVEVLDDLREMPRSRDPMRFPPRPVLGREELVVPTAEYRLTVPRAGSGGASNAIAWDSRQVGNVLLGDGVLFTLNSRWLSGFYDWHILLRRAHARLDAEPNDLDATLNLGDLLGRKGRTLAVEGRRQAALSAFTEARALLEPHVVESADADTRVTFSDKRVADSLHHVLRGEALTRAADADVAFALRLLERALALAPDSSERRDTLLATELLLREREPVRWLATMEELGALPNHLTVPWKHLTPERSPHPELDPWLAPEFTDAPHEVPLGLWVLVHRSLARAQRGEIAAELEDLHAILERYAPVPLGETNAADYCSLRISERLARDGRAIYQPFEERADTLLDAALASEDSFELTRVTQRFPHSEAALRAHRTLLDWAFERGDTAEVARRVHRALEHESPGSGGALLWKLARSLESEGNLAMARGLATSVAASDLGFDASAADRDAAQAAQTWLAAQPTEEQPRGYVGPGFDPSLRRVDEMNSKWEVLLRVALAETPVPSGTESDALHAAQDIAVLGSVRTLTAYSSADPQAPIWRFKTAEAITPAYKRGGVSATHDRLIVASEHTVVAIDAREGYQLWEFEERRGTIDSMTESEGLVLMLVQDSRARHWLRALDTSEGIELWNIALPAGNWVPPIHENGRAIFLTQRLAARPKALVIDLYRGRIENQFSLPQPPGAGSGAWVEDDVLILPRFQSSRAGDDLVALSLTNGERAWGIELESWEHLHSVLRTERGTFLVVFPHDPQSAGDGALLQLDTRLGATRSVMSLGVDLVPLGWRAQDTVALDAPWVFFQEDVPGATDTPVVAVELPYGKRWVTRLPVSQAELFSRGLPLPAISDSTAAIGYATKGRGPRLGSMHLQLVDLSSGQRLETRKLSNELSLSSSLELVPLGNGLVLAGAHSKDGRVEVWQNRPRDGGPEAR